MRRERIYILPTGFGVGFLGGAVVMILIGASYQNNLVNLLAFFMLSLVFIGMIQTHNNLKDVRVAQIEGEGCFAGGEYVITVVLANDAKVPRYNIEAKVKGVKAITVYENVHPILGGATLKLRSSYRGEKRGTVKIKGVRISTTYPLGIFRAWLWQSAETEILVYPERKGRTTLPMTGIADEENEAGRTVASRGGEDFRGHRKYQTSDSYRHIDWKAYARGRPLMTKEFDSGSAEAASFNYQLLISDPEERLSQLALWIDEARKQKVPFTLRVPGSSLGPGIGTLHATRCLEILARFNPGEQPAPKGRAA